MNRPRRLRIAVLNRHFGAHFGGAERYSVALVEQLASRHDIHVFAQHAEFGSFGGITFHRVPCPFAKPRWINQLWYATWTWWKTRHGFDVVHSHENTWHGQIQTVHVRPMRVGLFHGRSGIRRALKWLNIVTSPRLIAYWFLEASRFKPHANRCIVATSESVCADTLAAYPDAAGMISVIPPGVTLPVAPPEKAARRARLGLPADVPMALFIGNDYEKKGLPALLKAMASLPPALHLAVVGNSAHVPAFRKRAEGLGLAGRVHFLGSLNNVEPAYEAADLLVHPTTEDTYAMVVLEALAYGLPVVVSGPAHCGIAIDLEDGHNALIVDDPRDSRAIAGAVRRILDEPALVARFADAGRAFAAERGWDVMAERQESLYLAVCDRRP